MLYPHTKNKEAIMAELDEKVKLIAERVKGIRFDLGMSREQMAKDLGIKEEEYLELEQGKRDFGYSLLYKIAKTAGIDIAVLLDTDSMDKHYSITRKGHGLIIQRNRRKGYTYERMGSIFRDKYAEPIHCTIPYSDEALNPPYSLISHAGQEITMILSGTLKVFLDDKTEVLYPGDVLHFDSSIPHAEVAVGGQDVELFTIILNPDAWTDEKTYDSTVRESKVIADNVTNVDRVNDKTAIYNKYFEGVLGKDGILKSVKFNEEECKKFNFAFDCVDAIAAKDPDKTAMMWVANDGVTDHRYTFKEISRLSGKAANYFKSLGIAKGDKIMLVLKRHWQFWVCITALHKIGAVAIPASNQLREHDFEYRFKSSGAKGIICTPDGDTAEEAVKAAKGTDVELFVMVNGAREGWLDFDKEFMNFTSYFPRPADCAAGDDPMVMFFSSGTTAYPKMVMHSYRYALGHITTAKYWHNVDPEGLHFTISDTGWGKALWGKLYGAWLCEAPVFTFDFDKFNSDAILKMIGKYQVTTFCCPPTMLRFLVKENLAAYDLSSLTYCSTAGEALNPEVFHQWIKATGLRIMEGFGQTETTLVIANLVGSSIKMGSMGKPNPLYDVHILDPEGNECKVGETGEICAKTSESVPNGLFMCYYGSEEQTKDAWHDGYYHTGDTAFMDADGFIWYVGRTDDIIKSSGYRIGPNEIENVLMELPYILECAVTGAPDPKGVRGIVVKATIVLVKGKEATEYLKQEIQDYVKHKTAPYKYPRIVEFVDELPKSTSGKIRRVDIRKNDAKAAKDTKEEK